MANDRSEGNLIKAYREASGLSQRELAEEMAKTFPGVDKALISKMENGLCEPTEEMRAWCCNGINRLADERKQSEGSIPRSAISGFEKGYFTAFEQSILDRLANTDIEHRVTRGMLVALFGSSDRAVRKAIENLRASGIRVGSGLGDKGYWLIKDENEYKRFIAEYTSRAYAVIGNKFAMDGYTEGQMEYDLLV